MFLKRLVDYEATYAKTATSQKGTLPSARRCRCRCRWINQVIVFLNRRRRLPCFSSLLTPSSSLVCIDLHLRPSHYYNHPRLPHHNHYHHDCSLFRYIKHKTLCLLCKIMFSWTFCISFLCTTYSQLKDPVLVIIEYVPYGDLLGYLRKSRGLNDNYFKDPDIKPQTSLSSLQLILMSWQIADGMSYLSSRKVGWWVEAFNSRFYNIFRST